MGLEEIRRLKEQAKLPKYQKSYRIPKVSKKRAKEIQEQKAERVGGGNELDRWFQARHKEMKGVCAHCSGKTTKGNPQYFKHSIAHILPKRLFKSIATHPLNWIELCYFPPSCHANFDNNTLDMIELNCFDEVITKFVAMYPDIDPKERKYIPDILLQYIENEK